MIEPWLLIKGFELIKRLLKVIVKSLEIHFSKPFCILLRQLRRFELKRKSLYYKKPTT